MTPRLPSLAIPLLASALAAQAPKPAPPKPVTPYSAEQTTESTTIQPGGAAVTRHSVIFLARDASGRFRRETKSDFGDWIEIRDPVAGADYMLHPAAKTAVKSAYNPERPPPSPPADSVANPNGIVVARMVTEKLGARMIQGVQAEGTRTTTTYHAAAARPETRDVREAWVAADLGLTLRLTVADYDSHYTSDTVALQLEAPPPGLFLVPADYTFTAIPALDLTLAPRLFAQAKAALPPLPGEARPNFLAAIADDESLNFFSRDTLQAAAIADFDSAFDHALALPASGMAEPDETAARMAMKGQIELHIVASLDRLDTGAALQLARRADADAEPRSAMYGAVLAGLSNPASAGAAAIDVPALAQECRQATGAFPYAGAASALRGASLAPDARLDLVRAGYAAAGDETRTDSHLVTAAAPFPLYWNGLAQFLAAGHAQAPELDADLESALLELLPRLAALPPGPAAMRMETPLLSLLGKIDPGRAVGLQLQLPAAAAALAAPQPAPAQSAADPGPAASLSQALANPDAVRRFHALVNLSQFGGNFDAAVAAQAAAAALAMLDDHLLRQELPDSVQLAQNLDRLRQHPQALALLLRCLAETDRQAAAQARRSDGETYLQWIARLQKMTNRAWFRAYQVGAGIDPAATVAHAENLPDSIFKPLALATVAIGAH